MPALLEIDRTDFLADGATAQRVRHRLTDHPLLSVDAVADLADRLGPRGVEHNVADRIAAVTPGGAAPVLEATPGEVARGIEDNGCWMVLMGIEQDPAYAELLNAALDEVGGLLPGGAAAMQRRQGFIFLSAPGSVTPAHVDPEHNFLLQIRGTKTMNVGPFPDAATEQRELERSYGHGHRNMDFVPEGMAAHELHPGDGLYVPDGTPHWVQNGDTVSVSLSITWRTAANLRKQRAHAFNDRLRRRGLSPRAPGRLAPLDAAKAFSERVCTKAHHLRSRARR